MSRSNVAVDENDRTSTVATVRRWPGVAGYPLACRIGTHRATGPDLAEE